MLNVNPLIICTIITKAKEFHVKEAVVISDKYNTEDDYDWMQILADHRDDLTFQELSININELEPDQKVTLIALMYLGRGDYEVKDWVLAQDAARKARIQDVAEYLLSKPLIADFLEEGLSLLGYDCEGSI